MSAIYVQRGEEQVGPFTTEELEGKIAAGELSPEDLFWYEGMEDWQSLASVISAEADPGAGAEEETAAEEASPLPAAEEADVLHEIADTTITTRAVHLECGTALSLEEISKVAVQTETVHRGKPIVGCVLIGVVIVSLALAVWEFPLPTLSSWILWALVLLGLIFFWIRLLLRVLQVGASMVVIDLTDGDERIIRTTADTARQLRDAISATLPEIKADSEGDEESEEEDATVITSGEVEKIGLLSRIARWMKFRTASKNEAEPEGGGEEEPAETMSAPTPAVAANDIRHEIEGTKITARAVHLKSGGVLSFMEIARVAVQTETIHRGKPITGCVIVGLLIVGLALTKLPHTDDANWTLWLGLLVALVLLGIFFLKKALRKGDSMVVIKLKRGDERLIGATPETAQQLCEAIEKSLPSSSSAQRANRAAQKTRRR